MKPQKITLELDTDTPRNQITINRLLECHKKQTPFTAPEFDNAAYEVKEVKIKNGVHVVKLSLSK